MKAELVGTHCIAEGIVYGNYWGGGQGGFSSKVVAGRTVDEVLETATEMLDGSLDGGMGFESLIGALLDIRITKAVKVDGEEYTRTKIVRRYIGNLTQSQKLNLAKWRDG